jgi:phosphoserine phosphatase RsbU/P
VSRSLPPYLQLRSGETADELRPDLADLACVGELCQSFADATGWPLRYVAQPEPTEIVDLLWSAPVNPGVGETPGHLRIDLCGGSAVYESMRSDWEAAERMAGAIGELLNELFAARRALREREAELAAAIPVKPHRDEQGHLAVRLEATLRAGAQGIGCDSAALYLLDEATSQLKLRAAWGLPLEKFIRQARPLANQMADLEALVGHAVALESRDDMVGPWKSPEPAAAALCVPVSSPTVPLGTLWFFCKTSRPFTDEQTNVAEVVAGKIASDLERDVLLQEKTTSQQLAQQVQVVQRSQEYQLPTVSPPIPGWSLSGWAEQGQTFGGAFYDWRMLDDSSLFFMLGDACDGGLEAALASTALRAVLRGIDENSLDMDELLRRANRILWESSAGNWWAGLWMGQLHLTDGRCQFATAGRPSGLWLKPDGWASLAKPSEPLGLAPTIAAGRNGPLLMSPGESLVVCNRGIMECSDERGHPIDEAALARLLLKELSAAPQQMIDAVRNWLPPDLPRPLGEGRGEDASRKSQDRSILVLQRRLS